MGVFDNILASDQTLIKNEAALDFEFIPKSLPHREREQQRVAAAIAPLFKEHNGRNVFIFGSPGIGKTAAVKHILREMEDKTDDIVPLYVNCWQKNSTFKILVELCDLLDYKFTQNKKTTELMKVIETIVNKKSAVFVFDEIDKVEDFDFMYNLLEDIYKKAVILITNYKEWMVGLDERIKSRLTPESLEFKQYTLAETKDILNRRLEAAFHEGIWEDDAFEAVVQKTAGLKDIRTGIYLLREAAMHAEDRSSKKINIDDVQAAFAKMDDFTIKKSTELESETQQILKIVRENSGKKIGDLYKVYQDQGGEASYKTFQRKITSLEKNKFVSLTKSTGAGGNTTIVEKKLTEF